MIDIQQAMTVPEGDGITVNRLMPVADLRHFDPFVLWDHFDIESGGFPPHPHRGFEAITWLFSGAMQHKDNLGNEGTIHTGGAQRFTAGRGITHSEMPDGHAAGIQLWINLPQRLKRIDAEYQQVEAEGVSEEVGDDGIRMLHIVGDKGAIQLHTDVEYLDIRMPEKTSLERSIPAGWRGFIYSVEGSVRINDSTMHSGQAALIEKEAAIHIASMAPCHLMWCFGAAHHEPIHQHGPFVD
ncbi:MAG: pirin family protein [Mariprofundaceae bacterium]